MTNSCTRNGVLRTSSTYEATNARTTRGPALRRNASTTASAKPSRNAVTDRRSVSHAPSASRGRLSQTMPNWKTYFIRHRPGESGGSNQRQVDQLHFGVLLVDARERAVVLVQEHPGAQELQQVVIAGAH